jgi:hypothetical protein
MPIKPAQRLYEMGRRLRESEEQPITALPEHLVQPPNYKPSRPLKRELESLDEVFALYQQVLNANASWMADTIENKRRVCELFTSDDERISHRLDLNDMKNAATILSATLDRVPKPEAPRFPDDDLAQRLSDGEMPLAIDAPAFIQRRASIAQMRNLVARLKRQEVWQREQQQEPQ